MADITAKLSVKSGMNASMSRGGGGGQPGPPGYSPSASVTKVGDTTTITITDKDGTTTATVKDGADGQDGSDGVSPSVSVTAITGGHRVAVTDADGTETFNVMDGAKGDTGPSGEATVETVSGTNPVITGVANTRYICGEVSTISITPPASGIIDVIFTSGSSVAVLTVPNTVKWPSGFDPTSLEANTTYELNILDGVYGAVMTWAT
jgi:hypothetical protein